jgi:hypothetical protein
MKNKKKEIASITLSLAFCVSMMGSMVACSKRSGETATKREVNEIVTEDRSKTTSGTALEVTTRYTASGTAIVTTRLVTEGKTDSTTGKTTTESASERTSGVTTRVITTESTTGATTTEEVTWATTRETTTEYTTEATTRSTTESTTEQTTRETTTESTTEATTRTTTRETTTESTTEATTVHQHKWIWKTHTEQAWVDPVTHQEPVYDEGWTEYIYKEKIHCGVCGKFYDNMDDFIYYDGCGGSFSYQDVLVDTIEHEPEILYWDTITDVPGHFEDVIVKDYEYCSECGEKK